VTLKFSQAIPQSKRIELADREHADTALRASHAAYEPLAASPCDVSERGINNLHQLGVVL